MGMKWLINWIQEHGFSTSLNFLSAKLLKRIELAKSEEAKTKI